MHFYELTYLISPDLSEKEIKTLQDKIISLIQEKGGILGVEEKLPFKKKLAYPVKKQSQAYMTVINFQLPSEKLIDLEKKIKLENQILRYLILAKKESRAAKFSKKPPRSLKKIVEPKVELKEIEKKLEEILGGT
jgi:small subunit ribosomal protein S6